MSAPSSNSSATPLLALPQGETISVEHPCIIKNTERGIEMLGGSEAIAHALKSSTDRALALSFRPHDPSARTIISSRRPTHNVLLSITVPRRTGRKRKRGSHDDFVEYVSEQEPKKDVAYVLRSMNDNPERYQVAPISSISSTHVWRDMPDYVYSTTRSALVQQVKSKVLSQHLPLLRSFDLPQTYGLQDTEALPPPVWSMQTLPQNYAYRSNPLLKTTTDATTGERTTVRGYNLTAPKIYTAQMQWDTPDYPTTVMDGCPPLESDPNPQMQQIVDFIGPLFKERPIWTRRALLNAMPVHLSLNSLRFALAYVAFALRSGPWRDTYVRLGVDPRKDPECRFYQTIMLQLMPKDKRTGLEDRALYTRHWARSQDLKSHIFDGTKQVPADGKVWQLCDIADPQLQRLVNVPEDDIRNECDTRYFGWYKNGTITKLRIVLKAKVDALAAGETLDVGDLDLLLDLPEDIQYLENPGENGRAAPDDCYLPAGQSRRAYEWAALYRALGRTETGTSVPGEKLSVSRTKRVPIQATTGPRATNASKSAPKRKAALKRVAAAKAADQLPSQDTEPAGSQPHTPTVQEAEASTVPQDTSDLGALQRGRSERREIESTEMQQVSAPADEHSRQQAFEEGVELDGNGEIILPSIEDYLDNYDDELDLDIKIEDEGEEGWA